MNQFGSLSSDCMIFKIAAGAAGNIFAIGLFISPIPTFRRIIRNKSTEQFSGLPYIYALLNCLICMWYGTPFISTDNTMVLTVNSVGAAFQFAYIILFISFADKASKVLSLYSSLSLFFFFYLSSFLSISPSRSNKKHRCQVRMAGFLLAVIGFFTAVVIGSLQIVDHRLRRIIVGLISSASLISMFASPLFIINLVIRTKSVEYMPFYLSLSTFLMSSSFFLYGVFNSDLFIYIPNGMGTVLGTIQLVLYFYYRHSSGDKSMEPLMGLHA